MPPTVPRADPRTAISLSGVDVYSKRSQNKRVIPIGIVGTPLAVWALTAAGQPTWLVVLVGVVSAGATMGAALQVLRTRPPEEKPGS